MAQRSFKEVNVDVYRHGPNSLIVIDWEWDCSSIPLSRYCLDVYRGESPEELEKIASNLPAAAGDTYEDRTARLLDKHRTYHYQIVARDIQNGSEFKSAISTWEGGLDLVGLYIVEEHDFLFRYIAGTPVYIYKQQTSGEIRCDRCWDPIAKRITKSTCQTCHGTGFMGKGVGGYYDPTYTWVDLRPDPEVIQITQWGKVEPTQTDIFMSNYPRMSVGDLLIELTTDKRWKVTQITDTEKRRTKMLQIVRLQLINKDQVEYTIEVSKEVRERARRELNERKREPEF